jgi:RimJ/RimL family protein N-acetyltransferase
MKAKDIFGHTELFSDIETMKLFGGPTINNDLDIKDIVEFKRKEFESGAALFWVITLTNEKEFIGFIRLKSYGSYYFDSSFSAMGEQRNSPELMRYIDKKGWEIDYALLKKYRNKGIMDETIKVILDYCKEKRYTPIYAKVNSVQNIATVNLLKNNSFEELLPQANLQGELGMIYKWAK